MRIVRADISISRGVTGFTLVEMMVALLVFSLLSVAGVLLLRSAVDTNEAAGENLSQMADMQRLVSLMEADFSQTIPRTYRDQDGNRKPAMIDENQNDDGVFLSFVRGGHSNVNGKARSSLQRVEYRLNENQIERVTYDSTDGGDASAPAVLVDVVDDVRLRFRGKTGIWVSRWQSERLNDLPRAIEIQFTREDRPYRHVFLVGTGYF